MDSSRQGTDRSRGYGCGRHPGTDEGRSETGPPVDSPPLRPVQAVDRSPRGPGRRGRDVRFDDILLALIVRRPISGYDAKKWLDSHGLFLRANADQSQIYRTLHRLGKAGFVAHTREPRSTGPDAKVYRATELGVQHLLKLAHEPFVPQPRWQEPDFIARYSMLGLFAPETLPQLLETELDYRRAQVAQFRNRERRLDLDASAVAIDAEVAARLQEDAHRIGAAGADQWIEWLEDQLDQWRSRYAEESDSDTA
jgi:PadR family transcriptional regulator AphA